MGMFKKATPEVARLKVAFYGEAGSGKTYTSLLLATSLGKTAVIDTEHGSDIYAVQFDFDVLHTRSIKTVLEVLESEEIDNYDCIVVDSITHLWEDCQESYLKSLELSNDPKKRKKAELGEISFADWRIIKRPYKRLITVLNQLDKHVFICGRQTAVYEFKNGELVQTGVRMKADGDTPYEPHILIHMERRGQDVVAFVEKDRSGMIAGKTFVNPTPDMIKPVLEKLGSTHRYFYGDVYSTDIFQGEPPKNGKKNSIPPETLVAELPADVRKKIYDSFMELFGTEDALVEALMQEGIASLDVLTYGECRRLYAEFKRQRG